MTAPGPLDTLVLDLGNVLVPWDPRRAFDGLVEPAEVDRFLADVDFPELNRTLDAGRDWADARRELAAMGPWYARMLDLYLAHFPRTLTGEVPGMADLVSELHGLGVRLLGLTNWSAATFHHAVPAAPAVGLLEDVVVSGREGVGKPDRRIFELVVERFGLVVERTLFVDDSPANVRAARAVGLPAVVFTDAGALRADLRARGVPVAAA